MSNKPWGGAKKVYTSSKTLYDEISNHLKIDIKNLFHMAVVIGLKSKQEPVSLTKRTELLNCYSIDEDQILEVLLEIRYPNEHKVNLKNLLESFAEIGINILYNDFISNGNLDIGRYISGE